MSKLTQVRRSVEEPTNTVEGSDPPLTMAAISEMLDEAHRAGQLSADDLDHVTGQLRERESAAFQAECERVAAIPLLASPPDLDRPTLGAYRKKRSGRRQEDRPARRAARDEARQARRSAPPLTRENGARVGLGKAPIEHLAQRGVEGRRCGITKAFWTPAGQVVNRWLPCHQSTCPTCRPRWERARVVHYEARFAEVEAPVRAVRVHERFWRATQVRIGRAGGQFVWAAVGDDERTVFTTADLPGAEPVEDVAAALTSAFAELPEDGLEKGKRRCGASQGWGMPRESSDWIDLGTWARDVEELPSLASFCGLAAEVEAGGLQVTVTLPPEGVESPQWQRMARLGGLHVDERPFRRRAAASLRRMRAERDEEMSA